MDTRAKKSTEVGAKSSESVPKPPTVEEDRTEAGTSTPMTQDHAEEWRFLCQEFDDNLNSAINNLAVGKKQTAPQLCIYFEKIIPILRLWLSNYESEIPDTERPLVREFMRYATHAATVLKPKLITLKQKGTTDEVFFTAMDYRSFSSMLRAAVDERMSTNRKSDSEASGSVRSALSHHSERSANSNHRTQRENRYTYQPRGNRRGRGHSTRRHEISSPYDYSESPELLKELRRYQELPTPWNKTPSQSVRQERLDISRQVQMAGERQFKGDLEDYAKWRDFFLGTIGDVRCHARHKVNALRKSLDSVLETIIDFVPGDFNGYRQIVENLEKSYGGTFRQMSRYDSYFDSARFKFGVMENFREYIRKVAGYKSLLDTSGDANLFSTPHIYRRLLLPLPNGHVRELQTWLHSERLDPTACNLLLWGQDRLDRMITEKEVERRKEKTTIQTNLSGKEKQKTKVLVTRWVDEDEEEESEPEECLSNDPESDDEKENIPMVVQYVAVRPPEFCLLACSENHGLSVCPRFLAFDPERRRAYIRQWKILTCYVCLGYGHASKNCRSKSVCEVCRNKGHNTLLHLDRTKVTDSINSLFLSFSNIKLGILPQLPVKISKLNDSKLFFYVNAVLDTGSNVTILSTRMRNVLDTSDCFRNLGLNTAGGKVEKNTAIVKFSIWTQENRQITVTALSFQFDEIFRGMKVHELSNLKERYSYLKEVELKTITSSEIDLLIGNDLPGLTASVRTIKGPSETHPIAELSELGWSIRGPIDQLGTFTTCVESEESPNDERANIMEVLRRIEASWDIEDSLPHVHTSPSDRIAADIIKKTMSLQNGFVHSGILWKESHAPSIINNRPLAVKRLVSLLKTLEKKPEVSTLYHNTIEEWIREGSLVPTTERVLDGREYYLSHFPVIRMTKATTKVRVVVDASAKYRGVCLNDYILAGPNMTNDIRRVLLRFRRRTVAIVGDVKSMFTRIKLLENERSYHKILWGRNLSDIREYAFTCFTFGNTCSPSIAMSAAKFLTELFPDAYLRAKEAMLKSTIVDDTLDSLDSEEEAVEVVKKIQEIYKKGSMELRKIGSNSPVVLEAFSKEEISEEISLAFESSFPSSTTKTLGVTWSPSSDHLVYDLKFEEKNARSKRDLLSQLARIYDPLGLISPMLVKLKMIIQETWKEKKDWDEKLPQETLKVWQTTLDSLTSRVTFSRALIRKPSTNIVRKEVHIFSDASDKALGAVAYLSGEYTNGEKFSYIIMSSSKVTPLKFTTIPRLELQAAIEALNLAEHIVNALDLDPYAIYYWTDSADVLHWINSASRTLKIFVASRVGLIQKKSRTDRWNWVPTAQNPADMISRGTSASKLEASQLWKEGPVFLRDESQLPLSKSSELSPMAVKELKRKIIVRSITVMNPYWNEKLKRFSSWERFLRAIVRILGIIYKQMPLPDRCTLALYRITSLLQQELMQEEFTQLKNLQTLKASHPFGKFRLYYDKDTQALHASGRLSHAQHLPVLTRFPLFIPHKTYLSTIIIRHFHEQELKHMGGIKTLIASINSTFAIPYLANQAKRIVRTCVHCKRLSFRTSCPTLAPLPHFRQPQNARNEVFETSAIDCLGPLIVVSTPRKTKKIYVLVITCTFYRAVHLEIIESLSTDSFLLAFERFIASRNKPKTVISDNGRNFVGTWNALEKIFTHLPERLQSRFPKIKWLFNTPLDPHKGGIFERIVALTKLNLEKILRNKSTTTEEMHTIIKLVESALNNRPLQNSQQDLEDDEILTPNHFIRGSPYNTIIPNQSNLHSLKAWKTTQLLLDKFWKRFVDQFITGLNIHSKRKSHNIKYKKGDIVLVKDDTKTKSEINFPIWPIGKIVETYPGQDGTIRSVKIMLRGNEYLRGTTKIAPLLD